jgi:hypothetical protein
MVQQMGAIWYIATGDFWKSPNTSSRLTYRLYNKSYVVRCIILEGYKTQVRCTHQSASCNVHMLQEIDKRVP